MLRSALKSASNQNRRCRPNKYSGVIAALILTFAGNLASVPAIAQDDENLYLLDFHADGYLLAESVPAYQSDDLILVDFALFIEAVEFPIERDDQLWTGWFLSEDRRFVWRMDLGVVQIGDKLGERIAGEEWLDTTEGTFVSTEALERWFGLDLPVDLRAQVLNVNSSEPLPFQLWRERMLARYRYRSADEVDADVIVPDQYHWATLPLVDLSSHFLFQEQGESRNSTGTTSLAVGMDLLKHSVIYTGGVTQSRLGDGASTNRLTIERSSLTPETPMFAGVHRYTFGDIFQANPNLIVDSIAGRGFQIDRYPEGRTGTLGLVTIVGDAPPGWEVELYRNGSLIDIATVGVDGRYFFPNQEIPYGENVFIARLYGPQGQTREDRQVYWGGGSDLDKGDFDFSVSHIDFANYLLDGVADNRNGLAASYATSFRFVRAMTDELQLGGGYTRTGLGTRDRDGTFNDADYVSLFGSGNVGLGLLLGELVHQVDAGAALNLEFLTAFRDQKISIAHVTFHDYESPATIHRDDLDSINELSVFGSFGDDAQNAYTLGLRHRKLAEGSSDLRIFNRLSTRLGPVNLTNDFEYLVTPGSDTASGQIKLASRVKGVSVRGQLDYRLTEDRPLTQVSASMNWSLGGRLNNNFTISKQLVGSRLLYFTNLLSVRIRDYDLTFSMSSDFEDEWSVGAGFNIAFGYDRRRQEFVTDNGGLANTGRATMHVFIDEDNDGIRDADETPVQWASYRDQETLRSIPGVLPLTGIPVSRPVKFETRHMKFDDPFLMPSAQAYELQTHAGSDVRIEVAVVMTGDIEGHVMSGSADDAAAVRGIIITLHDKEGREVARTRSEFDGFYSFTGVPGGEYEVRVLENDGRTHQTQPLTLDPNDGFVVLERMYIFE